MSCRACCSTGLCSWCRQKQAVGSRNWSLHGQMDEAGSGKPNGAVATSGAPHPSKLWRKHVCRMKQTHTEKQEESVRLQRAKPRVPETRLHFASWPWSPWTAGINAANPPFPKQTSCRGLSARLQAGQGSSLRLSNSWIHRKAWIHKEAFSATEY